MCDLTIDQMQRVHTRADDYLERTVREFRGDLEKTIKELAFKAELNLFQKEVAQRDSLRKQDEINRLAQTNMDLRQVIH